MLKSIFLVSILFISSSSPAWGADLEAAKQVQEYLAKLPKKRVVLASRDDLVLVDQTIDGIPSAGHTYLLQAEPSGSELGSMAAIVLDEKAMLANLYIKKHVRGAGYARFLLSGAVQSLVEQGVHEIYLGADPFEMNEAGGMVMLAGEGRDSALQKLISFYESCGFIAAEEREEFPLSLCKRHVMKLQQPPT